MPPPTTFASKSGAIRQFYGMGLKRLREHTATADAYQEVLEDDGAGRSKRANASRIECQLIRMNTTLRSLERAMLKAKENWAKWDTLCFGNDDETLYRETWKAEEGHNVPELLSDAEEAFDHVKGLIGVATVLHSRLSDELKDETFNLSGGGGGGSGFSSVPPAAPMAPAFGYPSIPTRPPIPTIKPPHFGGDVGEFPQFLQIFEAVIDSQPLSNVQKLAHLLSLLKGDAKRAVDSYPLLAENYDEVKRVLIHKYGRKDVIQSRLIEDLMSLKDPKDRVADLRSFLEAVQRISRQLENQGCHLDSALATHAIQTKLPPSINSELNKIRLGRDEWNLELLCKYMSSTLEVREETERMQDIQLSRRSTHVTGGGMNHFYRKEPERLDRRRDSRDDASRGRRADEDDYRREPWRTIRRVDFGLDDKRTSYAVDKRRIKCFRCGEHGHRVAMCWSAKPANERKPKRMSAQQSGDARERSTSANEAQNAEQVEYQPAPTPTFEPRARELHPKGILKSSKVNGAPVVYEVDEESSVLEPEIPSERIDRLPLVMVDVINEKSKKSIRLAALLDTGANANFVTTSVQKQLGLPSKPEHGVQLIGFGGRSKKAVTTSVRLGIRLQSGEVMPLEATAMPQLMHRLPVTEVKVNGCKTLRLEPQMIIGTQHVWNLLRIPTRKNEEGFTIVSTAIGDVVIGEDRLTRPPDNSTSRGREERLRRAKSRTNGAFESRQTADGVRDWRKEPQTEGKQRTPLDRKNEPHNAKPPDPKQSKAPGQSGQPQFVNVITLMSIVKRRQRKAIKPTGSKSPDGTRERVGRWTAREPPPAAKMKTDTKQSARATQAKRAKGRGQRNGVVVTTDRMRTVESTVQVYGRGIHWKEWSARRSFHQKPPDGRMNRDCSATEVKPAEESDYSHIGRH